MIKDLQQLYDCIELQPQIRQKLNHLQKEMELKIEEIHPYLDCLMDSSSAALAYESLKTYLGEDEGQLRMLWCQLECARRLSARYETKQIPKTVYADTMKCFTRFLSECEKKNGRMFFDRGWWTYRQVSMSLFRIGELEYQFKEQEGERVVAVHIPSDADLSKEAVDDSFRQAEQFFQAYYRGYRYGRYVCDSWLLSPALRSLLPQDSNILAFQNRFTLTKTDAADTEFMNWLFQVPADTDPRMLPEKTSLQKKAKELLLNGGTIGSACGRIVHAAVSEGGRQ